MSKIYQRGNAKIEMNMTPLIDVTFQLIIFFMLVNNIISEETVQMVPPDLENPVTHDLGEVKRVVISVAPMPFKPADRKSNPMLHPGEAVAVHVGALVTVGMNQMDVVTEELKRAVAAAPKNAQGESELEVVLRADCAIFYDEVQRVLGAITGAGVSKINMVALMPKDDEPRRNTPAPRWITECSPMSQADLKALTNGATSQEDVPHQNVRQREVKRTNMQLNLTSMIDVIFQLLIYFVITASFAVGEGVITAKLPQGPGVPSPAELPKQPLNIMLQSQGGYEVRIGIEGISEAPSNFSQLAELLSRVQFDPSRGRTGAYKPDNPVIIKPDGQVRWQHVVNAFNAAVKARYDNISFAQARSE